MKKIFVGVSILVGIGFLGAVGYSIMDLERQDKLHVEPQVIEGKKIWQREGCMSCHAIFGNGGYSASDLTQLMATRDEKWIKNYFADPPVMPLSTDKTHLSLPEEDVEKLIKFFQWVEEIDTKQWPPNPNQ